MTSQPLVLEPGWVVPVAPSGALEHHAVLIDDGRISALGPRDVLRTEFPAAGRLELPSHAVLPGLVNAHTHAGMALFRGMSDDLPLMTWLTEHIWPTEGRFASPEFTRAGSRLAIAEFIRGGITCFNDMYFFPGEAAALAAQAGIRAVLGLVIIDFPNAWSSSADDAIDKGLALHDQLRAEPLLSTAFGPHAPYTVSDGPLERIRMLADELDIPVHMHVHETAAEVSDFQAQRGLRPLAHLDALGLLNERLLAVHMTQLLPEEIALVARRGVHVLHCPESNLKLASGFCPVTELQAAGVNIAIGTDGAASNNDLSMFGELRTASLLAKGVSGDATAFNAASTLEAATLGGARALGLDNDIGSVEVGKSADLIAVDLGQPETTPVYDPVSQIVYAAGAHQVTHTWVAGRELMRDRELLTMDAEEAMRDANDWRRRIAGAGSLE